MSNPDPNKRPPTGTFTVRPSFPTQPAAPQGDRKVDTQSWIVPGAAGGSPKTPSQADTVFSPQQQLAAQVQPVVPDTPKITPPAPVSLNFEQQQVRQVSSFAATWSLWATPAAAEPFLGQPLAQRRLGRWATACLLAGLMLLAAGITTLLGHMVATMILATCAVNLWLIAEISCRPRKES